MRPFFEDGHTVLYLADCLTIPWLVHRPVHLIVTSPPYNLGKDYGSTSDERTYEDYMQNVQRWGEAWQQVLAPGARVAINVPIDTNGERTGRGKGSHKLTTKKRFLLADYHRMAHGLGVVDERERPLDHDADRGDPRLLLADAETSRRPRKRKRRGPRRVPRVVARQLALPR